MRWLQKRQLWTAANYNKEVLDLQYTHWLGCLAHAGRTGTFSSPASCLPHSALSPRQQNNKKHILYQYKRTFSLPASCLPHSAQSLGAKQQEACTSLKRTSIKWYILQYFRSVGNSCLQGWEFAHLFSQRIARFLQKMSK